MPCLYGACFYYNKNSACAYVDDKGRSHLISCKNKAKIIYHNIILLRGIEYFIFGLYFFVKNLVRMPFKYSNISLAKNVSKSLNISLKHTSFVIIMIISLILSFFLIGYLPIKLAVILSGYSSNVFLNRFLVGIVKILILFIILLILKCFVPFKQFYRFNACANLLLDGDKENIHKPTNLLNYIVFSFVVNFLVISLIGFTSNEIWKPFVNLIISVICISISYEILLLLEKSKFSWLKKSCIVTSFLITERPTKTEIYISNSALNEVNFMKNKMRKEVNTKDFKENEISFSSVYAETKQKLFNAGIEDTSEVDWLICEVLGINRGKLKLQTKITLEKKKQIDNAILRRIKGEPITKIFGRTSFYGYDFKVTKDVLSPRQETEILVEQVLKFAKDKMNILDIGTGSGIISISIAKNINANITAIDVSEKALVVAEQNAKINNVKINFKNSNLFENLKSSKKFDIIVSNPPYIPTQDINKLEKEVKDYDPKFALDGGEDGLDFYKRIILNAPRYLAKNGKIFFEIGIGQKNDIVELLKQEFTDITTIKDYNKIDRVIYATLNKRK